MNFLSNIGHRSTLLIGMGCLALSECLRNEESLVGRTTHTALIALSTGLLLHSTRQVHSIPNVCYTQHTALPDLSRTPEQRNHNLSDNQLTAPPDLSRTPELRELNLSGNELTAPPDLSHTHELRKLSLSN